MRKNTHIILVAAVFFLFVSTAASGSSDSRPSEAKTGENNISLDATEKPLGDVLRTIAEKSGYAISIDADYASLPVSSAFQDLTLQQALRRVLGKMNRYVLINETDRSITLGFIGDRVASGADAADQAGSQTHSADLEVVPPDEPGGAAPAIRDVEKMRKAQAPYHPEDVELVPPETPGSQGITFKDIEKKKYDPSKLEIIPPDQPGKKGLSRNEIETLKHQKR